VLVAELHGVGTLPDVSLRILQSQCGISQAFDPQKITGQPAGTFQAICRPGVFYKPSTHPRQKDSLLARLELATDIGLRSSHDTLTYSRLPFGHIPVF